MPELTAHRSNPGQDIDLIVKQLNIVVARVNTLQTAFNVAIAKMNLDAGITDVNYLPIAGTVIDTVALGY